MSDSHSTRTCCVRLQERNHFVHQTTALYLSNTVTKKPRPLSRQKWNITLYHIRQSWKYRHYFQQSHLLNERVSNIRNWYKRRSGQINCQTAHVQSLPRVGKSRANTIDQRRNSDKGLTIMGLVKATSIPRDVLVTAATKWTSVQ